MMMSVKVKNQKIGVEAELEKFNSALNLLYLSSGLVVIDALCEWTFFDDESGEWLQCFRGEHDRHKC